jgi:nicotinamide-nucleotide amidase
MKGTQGIVICMPGVPHELKGMVRDSVIPFLRAEFGMRGVLHYRALKVCGIGESRIDDRMGDLINALSNPTVGLLANPEATRIRIAAHAETLEQAEAMIAAVETQVRERLPGLIFGADTDTIESVVAALLVARGWKLALLETTTGGMITQRLLSANPDCVAGAEILPGPPPGPEGVSPEEAALDLARNKMVGSPLLCALAAVADPARRRTVVAFVSPEAEAQWEIGEFASGQRNQLRAAIYSLERIRRALIGIQAED